MFLPTAFGIEGARAVAADAAGWRWRWHWWMVDEYAGTTCPSSSTWSSIRAPSAAAHWPATVRRGSCATTSRAACTAILHPSTQKLRVFFSCRRVLSLWIVCSRCYRQFIIISVFFSSLNVNIGLLSSIFGCQRHLSAYNRSKSKWWWLYNNNKSIRCIIKIKLN